MIYHPIRLNSGTTIYLPTSIPIDLQRFVDTSGLIQDKELDAFKRKVLAMERL